MGERELFEEKMCHKLVGVFDNDLNCYSELTDQLMWDAWQASTARQGYKLVPNVCKHESDGLAYTSMPVKYKCKICGNFYTKI